jgi:RecA/RadA recombinase
MSHPGEVNDDVMKRRRDMPLSHLPLRPSVQEMLKICGFERVGEVWDTKQRGGISNLAAEWNDMELSQAHRIYREIIKAIVSIHESSFPEAAGTRGITDSATVSAMELLQATKQQQQQQPSSGSPTNDSIITFSRSIDTMLAGGIALGEFTELAGAPGTGKTQMAMQLAVNAALPACAGGVHGSTIYIDTEGSFAPERCYTLAQHLIAHIQGGMRKRNMPLWNITTEEILDNIHVFRVHTVTDLILVLEGGIPKLLQQQQQQQQKYKPVRLIVVDSFAFPYRADDATDFVHRTRQLTMQICTLTKLARVHQLAVLAINQMTTKLDGTLVPSLGESWAHAVTTRLVLQSEEENQQQYQSRHRLCRLVKSPRLPTSFAEFQILEKGVRDVDLHKHNSIQQPKRARTN